MSNKVVGIAAVFIFLMLIVGTILIVASRNKGKSQNTPAPTTVSSNQPVTLTIWRTFDEDSTFKQSIQDYLQEKPNIKINYVKKDLADYEVQLLNALAAGTGPDIASLSNQLIQRHQDKLSPLPDDFFKTLIKGETRSNADFYKAAFVPAATSDNVIEGKVYGMPLYVDTLALYINTKLWEEAQKAYRDANVNNLNFDDSLFRNPPATWNELLLELPYLVKKDSKGGITQAAISLGTNANISNAPDILSLLMLQNGTRMVDVGQKLALFNGFQNDATGKPVYSGTNALDFYTSFARDDKSNYSWNTSQPDSLQAFIDGKSALYIGYQYASQVLKQRAPTMQYSIGPIPQVKGGATINYASYWTETVTNNSKNPGVAWDFITYIASHPYPYLQSTGRPLAIVSPDRTDDPFNKQATTAVTWPKGKHPEKVDQIFNEMIDNVVTKKQPLQASIDNAANAVSELLQKE